MAWQLAMAVCAAMSAVGQKGVSLFVVIGDSVLFCLVVFVVVASSVCRPSDPRRAVCE